MPNAIVRAAATGLPSAIFNRRRMLLGLAAASTAAAGPIAVAAGAQAPAEAAELMDLGAKTPFALANYRQAIEAREAIVRKWAPKWPSAPKSIHNPGSYSQAETDLTGRMAPDCVWIWDREKLQDSIARIPSHTLRKGAKPERVARANAAWSALEAERESTLEALNAYHSQCAGIRRASGIIPAQAAEEAARDALLAHTRAIMVLEPATMAGVLIQAEALQAVAHVPDIQRVVWKGNAVSLHEGYGERIAASILRIARNA
ncbi:MULTISPECIES: hypothetical protein [unclassified Bosea (in: a-proteobacteria)]|uniref:hypothetical protein n=1 Tax=unclassified Bosea (in: a-proteobacteria) TaxID=2653178 RepID=UPI000F751B4F|nr:MULTISPECIES: hypothetical protein [unclassified Bosea (in: a-proteobacteria)]AZO79648.1 hypothetical protein BLM15_20085 [Bosea sp. Tri-49]RXT16107.1 hypothetical protein B5U98_29310 [Bosea sp. Tri-39]RXT39799.1 hypothetical protein B5U99_06355 [Bosea sp. Tri-54]